jgi:hypothetical protein
MNPSKSIWLIATVLIWFGTEARSPAQPKSAKDSPSLEVQLRGRLVRSAEKPASSLAFKTGDGKQFTLARTKLSEALFADARLMEKELQLKGRVSQQVFDVTVIRTVVNGVVHDFYYWCDICAIQQVAPGECLCCRESVRLVEKPVKD